MTELNENKNMSVSGLFLKYKSWMPNLTEEQEEKLSVYYEQLCTRALQENIIGKTDPENIWLKHVLDSLLPLQEQKFREVLERGKSVSDLGTGAGLPGLVYAILFPSKKFILIEMAIKRVSFLNDMISLLNLKNVEIWHGQVEKFSSKTDIVMYRAFRKPLASLEMALGVLNSGGKVLYWRANRFDRVMGENSQFSPETGHLEKIKNRIRDLGFSSPEFFELGCPSELGHRGIYIFNFNGNPRKGFPRKWKKIHEDNLINEVV